MIFDVLLGAIFYRKWTIIIAIIGLKSVRAICTFKSYR